MKHDREYLAGLEQKLRAEGFTVSSILAMGEPATEIIKLAQAEPVELIAMSTHGHRLISDLLYGSTADKVRHNVDIPVLLLKVKD
jgi:manganese transport protein